jgi:hypothetical protein
VEIVRVHSAPYVIKNRYSLKTSQFDDTRAVRPPGVRRPRKDCVNCPPDPHFLLSCAPETVTRRFVGKSSEESCVGRFITL